MLRDFYLLHDTVRNQLYNLRQFFNHPAHSPLICKTKRTRLFATSLTLKMLVLCCFKLSGVDKLAYIKTAVYTGLVRNKSSNKINPLSPFLLYSFFFPSYLFPSLFLSLLPPFRCDMKDEDWGIYGETWWAIRH